MTEKWTQRQLLEYQRQSRDRKRKLHSQAYAYMVGFHQRNGRVPDTQELSQWLQDMGREPRVTRLIEGMIEHGWLLQHGTGYRIRTQTDPQSIIEALITAYEQRNDTLFREITDLWRRHQGAAIGRIGRRRDAP